MLAYALYGLVRRAVLAAVEQMTYWSATGGHVLSQPDFCRVDNAAVRSP